MASISSSLEDYLEGILLLQRRNQDARVADLARMLGVKRPSVVKSLNRLKELGCVRQEPYGKIELTRTGQTRAREVLKRHQGIEHFLVDVLGVSPRDAEKEACRIEHVISRRTFSRLARLTEYLGQGRALSPAARKHLSDFVGGAAVRGEHD
ncbi:MAG: metal-dependent transcriptional regulator [Candidatus Omnitrophota bacterium]